jgi:hypothetical protein
LTDILFYPGKETGLFVDIALLDGYLPDLDRELGSGELGLLTF